MNHLFISINTSCLTKNLFVRANDKLERLGRLLSKKWLVFPFYVSVNTCISLLDKFSFARLWKFKAGTHLITLLERLSSISLGNYWLDKLERDWILLPDRSRIFSLSSLSLGINVILFLLKISVLSYFKSLSANLSILDILFLAMFMSLSDGRSNYGICSILFDSISRASTFLMLH